MHYQNLREKEKNYGDEQTREQRAREGIIMDVVVVAVVFVAIEGEGVVVVVLLESLPGIRRRRTRRKKKIHLKLFEEIHSH